VGCGFRRDHAVQIRQNPKLTENRQASNLRKEVNMPTKKKWSAKVHTESTFPPEGLFKKDAAAIARGLASRRVSPKGPASGMRMLTFYINRAGKNLSASRHAELEKAKKLLSQRIHRDRDKKAA
jgi:tRNA(adenine34) deaminase